MRSSGILMHITSLPGPYGVGTMGKEAYRFVDFLEEAGQNYWQILPLTPTGYGDSPYQSCSTYAGNHYLIDLDQLVNEGLLEKQEVEGCRWFVTEQRVDFGLLYQSRLAVLRKAFERFEENTEFRSFCRKQNAWLPDFALFMALKQKFNGMPWYQWEAPIKFRKPTALKECRTELAEEIRFYCFIQYLFYTQWEALRDYAHGKGIKIIGRAHLRAPRLGRGVDRSFYVPAGPGSEPRSCGRLPAGLFFRGRPALGQSPVPLGCAQEAEFQLVGPTYGCCRRAV